MQVNNVGTSQNPYLQANQEMDETQVTQLKEKIQSGEVSAKTLSHSYLVQYSLQIQQYSSNSITSQSAPFDMAKVGDILKTIDFEAIGYTGKSLDQMSLDEAKALVSEDGFFGIAQTSERLANFVLSGGGDNLDRLKAGREGIIRGFNEAEKIWGGKLPDISYETLDKALAKMA